MGTSARSAVAGVGAALAAASMTLSMAIAVPAAAGVAETVPLAPAVAEDAQQSAEEVVEGLEDLYAVAFLDEPVAVEQSAEELVEDLEVSDAGEETIVELGESIQAEAEAVTSDSGADLVVDGVKVEQVGEPAVTQSEDGTVSAIVDVKITRHIGTDDVDWVEVIPHEVVVDATGDEVVEVIPHTTEYQIEQAAEEQVVPRLMDLPDETTTIKPTGLSSTSRDKVAAYARKYYDNYNANYKKYDLDCTNFASQAMLAGGWDEKSHPWPDWKSDKAWWYGGIPTNSWTWSGAENFYRMTKALDRTTTAKYVTDLRVGDLLQYKAKGAANMTHSMIVTKKSGTNIYLTYHTSDTLNKPFSALADKKVTWFGHHV